MKIMIINPDSGMKTEELELRCRMLSETIGPDTELTMECLTQTNVSIDSALDVVLAGPEIVKRAMRAEEEGYDAVVLYCFSDPALDACREVLHIPVVGGGQAACLTAAMLGRQAGILVTGRNRIPEKWIDRYRTGIRPDLITAIHPADVSGIDVWKERDQALERLCTAAQKMMEEDGVQVIILGCLAFLGLAEPMSIRLGVPVVDAAKAAVAAAESLVRQKLFTSKAAYAMPPAGERSWEKGSINI